MNKNQLKKNLSPQGFIPLPSGKLLRTNSSVPNAGPNPQGPQGRQGFQGSPIYPQGFQGPLNPPGGAQGSRGVQGFNGPQGDAGFAGSQTIRGFQGSNSGGIVGLIGAQGSVGFQGSEAPAETPSAIVSKTADETRSSVAAIAVDATLQIALAANTKYVFEMCIFYKNDTGQSIGMACRPDYSGTLATGSLTYIQEINYPSNAEFSEKYAYGVTSFTTEASTTITNPGFYRAFGSLTTDTSGTFSFYWRLGSGTFYTIKKGSFIEIFQEYL